MEMAPSWALLTVTVLFTFFPLSLAYTVIVQRALDLRIILRQGTRYAFARGTLWVLQVIVFAFLGFRLFHFAHTSGRAAQLIAPVVFVVVVLFLRLRIARPLSLWLDRRFFREAYSVDQVLIELSEQARSFTRNGALAADHYGAHQPDAARGADLLPAAPGKSFQPAVCPGDSRYASTFPWRTIPRPSAPWRLSAAPSRSTSSVPTPGWRWRPATEVSVLNRLEAELLLPLPGRSGLIGVMALGPKLSEEPYSRSDRQLLSSVALQTGLAIENSALVHRLAEESAQRQRIEREIEIAR